MRAVSFDYMPPVSPAHPLRMDVACFIGFVPMRPLPALPSFLEKWLRENGWRDRVGNPGANGNFRLRDVPVPVESWSCFQALFAGEKRLLAAGTEKVTVDCCLAAAVRSFFNGGGRKCYVIRLGDPLPLDAGEEQRIGPLSLLLGAEPGKSYIRKGRLRDLLTCPLPPWARASSGAGSFHSLSHVHGLPDVVYACLPDLADLLSTTARQEYSPVLPALREQFVECGREQARPEESTARFIRPATCSPLGFKLWQRLIGHLLDFVDQPGQTFHLVAAPPLPDKELQAELRKHEGWQGYFNHRRLHLPFPWCCTSQGRNLPGGCEPPEGIYIGIQAYQALHQGAYRSAASMRLPEVYDLAPGELSDREKEQREGLAVIGRTVDGFRLLSDTTSSRDPHFSSGPVSRLLTLILRAAQQQGTAAVFEPLGRNTWRQVEVALENLLRTIYEDGGLRGRDAGDAFEVICDRRTMTAADIDNGRLIATVGFQPALPVERIHVSLALDRNRVYLREAV